MRYYKWLFLLIIFTASCARGCARFNRGFQTGERNYIIEMYSGGVLVFSDTCRTIVNNSGESDGIYYENEQGELIEVGGDYILISQ